MRPIKLVVGLVIGVILLTLVMVVVLDPGSDDSCSPDGGLSGGGGGVPAGELSLPIAEGEFVVSSTYKSADRPGHRGIDLAAPDGTSMYAMAGGVVVDAGPASGFGNWIVIDHTIDGQAYSTVYGHMWDDGVAVSTGDTVTAGQYIGKVGSAGQSSGPHLHFEVWEGGRLSGGTETNPQPWLDKAISPGAGSADTDTTKSKDTEPTEEKDGDTDTDSSARRPAPRSGGELPSSEKILSEDKLQIDSIRVARAVAQRFPDVQTIGGWRPKDKFDDHPSGRAVDIMIPNFQSDEGRELGNRIKNYLFEHREFFNIDYMIWRQMYIPAQGEPNLMADRFDLTQNHFDHVHVTTFASGFPEPGQKFGTAPTDGADNTDETTGAPGGGDCGPDFGHRDLNTGEIPEELRKWIALGGQVCREVDSPLLAGLLYQESQFQAGAVSPRGAQGYGQFMPDTWAGYGAKVDENGQIAGPPGSGSPTDPADATMASARYLCWIADYQRDRIASGDLEGDPQTLMLAGYNAGPGHVDQYNGLPPFDETHAYVIKVAEHAARFANA
ncbi:peptidoglycan DD-metalloendopeptidase family protein [Corynebacterium sp.]|uniref:peptidoglycan DD-metalloendopeptidase family protein n=1 Tax=Corynebacterium sp. TaxID=1720 RepID=UPI0026DEDA74|nr:peptidoglycan DD-metalloendopeptidase family protein [Corynebacterium sp.]MDO5511842.1 peptidoglycan DD-metalloendopeptidase family protein [Corynebacterium sp.]